MCPQLRALLRQPQIRPPDRLSAHFPPHLLRLPLLITDRAVRNRMNHMHPLRAELPRQTLRQLPHARAPRPVRAVLCVCAQRAQRAGEDQGALLCAGGGVEVGVAVVLEEHFEGFLREGRGAADVGFEAGGEGGVGFFHEGCFGGVLDAVDGDGEFEGGEGGVGADGGEGAG